MKRINPIISTLIVVLFLYGIYKVFDYYYAVTIGNTPNWLIDLMRSGM